MTDDDLKQWIVYHYENHAGFKWVTKYSTHILLLPSGEQKPILCHLEAAKGGGENAPKTIGRIEPCHHCIQVGKQTHYVSLMARSFSDLIELHKFSQKNVYRITMRWIMTVKDHSTGLTAIFALPRKYAMYVTHGLTSTLDWFVSITINCFHKNKLLYIKILICF